MEARLNTSLLLVDDEASLRDSLSFVLSGQGYQVRTAASGLECLEAVAQAPPDLILLDVMLPGLDGLEVCRRLRSQGFAGLVLLLTARDEEIDQVLGLETGADDYITKPFRQRELLARLRAHLRRLERLQSSPQQVVAGPLTWWPSRREVLRGEQRLELSPKEYQLLTFFIENKGQLLTHERLLEHCWGYDFEGENRVVKVTIQRLRDKIGDNLITTLRGSGYRLDV